MIWDYFDVLGEITKLSLVSISAVSPVPRYWEVFTLQKFRTGKMITLFITSVINKMSLGNPTRNNL